MSTTQCTLKRCQGKRGCICPKGKNLPSGTFSGSKPTTTATTTLPAIAKKEQTKAVAKKPAPSKPKPKQDSNTTHQPPLACVDPRETTPPQPSIAPSQPSEPLADDPRANGKVLVRYNHYKKEFPIARGSTTAAAIDAQYFLSGVFPNSKLHLSQFGPSDFSFEQAGMTERPMVPESPVGVYGGLVTGETYWIHIEEDSTEREAYEKRQEAFAASKAKDRTEQEEREKRGGGIVKEKVESCSCIEGNPCVDKYCCKDWDNRHAVAKKHGWKGFQ
ncbi:Aste57867_24728 [Aphanomyces stellatus]|uniref:Aste57867_24728 protein n=1 Tax=Aphanomyces stellatus TaxID=120398 RepID=A0A485LR75_9STRA|nr:hypothetical protein As57867_024650 [Aphanomyces stellatus]VFU01365.1 Aste57867_24728 [Aphanomyces stellatus]